jgi:RNA polymerase sigma factor (sigma-70 family)
MGPNDSRGDADLLASTAHERDAFAVFYRRYVDNVFAFFITRTGQPELAADLTAETFAAALGSARGYRGGGAPNAGPWLFQIAHNKLRDSQRRGRVADRARRDLDMEPIELSEVELDRVMERLDFAAHEEWLRELLSELPAPQRQAILARVVEEQSYSEIAADLKCSESVVRQRVSRGLTQLRARYSEER